MCCACKTCCGMLLRAGTPLFPACLLACIASHQAGIGTVSHGAERSCGQALRPYWVTTILSFFGCGKQMQSGTRIAQPGNICHPGQTVCLRALHAAASAVTDCAGIGAGRSCKSGCMHSRAQTCHWGRVFCFLGAAGLTRITCMASSWSSGLSRAPSPSALPSPDSRSALHSPVNAKHALSACTAHLPFCSVISAKKSH